ncbi:MAG: hypothetical protein IJE17_04025 [Clostridia bacterium]|nr:hypothetical protein [Clostridia bacterium]
MMEKKMAPPKEQAYSNISVRSFLTVVAILLAFLLLCGSLSYFIPQGAFKGIWMAIFCPTHTGWAN